MKINQMSDNREKQHLPRLEHGAYCGQAHVHWTYTIESRRTGWVSPVFYYKFRELLTHTAFRYSIACPIFTLMPDHLHMIWIGIDDESDQVKASRYFRKQLRIPLGKLGFDFQHQPHDRVLRENEKRESDFHGLVEYIARNPERAGLVTTDGYQNYPYTNCLIPGYPELTIWQSDFWPRFWRSYSFLCKNGHFRSRDEELHD